MADQKKWFKVWFSILIDPDYNNMALEDVGRWTRLGAFIGCSGQDGTLTITPPAKQFLTAMECPNFDALFEALKRLPNVVIERRNEEGKSVNGAITVSMRNWFKYQVDSTASERVTRSRRKRREEEKRRESLSSKGSLSQESPRSAPPDAPATRGSHYGKVNGAPTVHPTPPPPKVRIEADERPEYGHDDFLAIGHRSSKMPTDSFGWEHLLNSLENVERVQSKLREKNYNPPAHAVAGGGDDVF